MIVKHHNKLFNWYLDEPILDDLDEKLEEE